MRTALSLAFICLLFPTMAAADSIVVVVRGDRPEREESSRAGAETALRNRGLQVVPFQTAVVDKGLNPAEVENCSGSGSECMKLAIAPAEADRVLFLQLKAEVASEGEARTVIVGWYIDGKSGRKLQGDQRFCERCTTLEALASTARELAGQLADADAAKEAPETWIEVQSTPKDAQISIDGKLVGVAGQKYQVAPGEHEVRIERDGFAPIVEKVELSPNETRVLRLRMSRAEGKPWRPSPALTWGAMGAGAALTTLGIVWIAVDGPQFENGMRKRDKNNTMVPGLISTTLGVALMATSAVYLFKARNERSENASSMAIVPTRGGFSVGLSGQF